MSIINSSSEDKKMYLSPDIEIIEIKLSSDILSSSGEETLAPVSEHTLPPFDPDEDPIGD